jgi:class 3 adenylate cyclase/tetratricopeptide (TPR) repeat protein
MAAPPAEARKTVTIVFTDLVGSTALAEQLDPETLRHVLTRYFDAISATLERHGGTVEKFIGDAVMAVFGIPALHEDDALRATRAAVEMRGVLERLNDALEEEHGVRVETRTGVNTGEVVSADGAGEQKLATGDAINVAARLEQSAEAGEILIGAETYRLVRGAVVADALPPVAAKGKREPLAVWIVRDLVAEPPATEDGPLVGRVAELALLREVFAGTVAANTCSLVTIVGPPGIGKTRLARELFGTVDDAQVVLGRCVAYGEGVTYAPLAEIVTQITADVPNLLAGHEDADAIEQRLAAAGGTAGLAASPEEIGWAFRKLFEAAGRRRPLVVVVDDVHWAEPVLLDILEYIVGFSSDSPILLVCLARPDLFDVRPAWAAPGRNATVVSLEPLTDDDARSLIAHLETGRGLSDGLQAQIVSASGGYPLFVEQMLALHADDPQADTVMPPSIQALLAARIDRLEPQEREVLARASVEGRQFHRRAVAELLPAGVRRDVGAHLLSLVRKDFLRPDRALFRDDDAFRFGHVLIRDVAYNLTPKELRAELHERYARWLEGQLDERSDEYIEIVGFHLEQACRYRADLGMASDGLRDEAGSRLWRAARIASRRMDFPAAVTLYERAVVLLPDEPTGDLLREFAATLGRTVDIRALAVVEEAIARSHAAGNRPTELRARLDSLWMPQAGSGLRPSATLRAEVEALIPTLQDLDDDAGLTNAWQLVAVSERSAGQHARALDALERAQHHATLAGDRLEESEVRVIRFESVRDGAISVERSITLCERELHERRGDWMVEMSVLACMSTLYAMRGRFDLAREGIGRAIALSEEFSFWAVRPAYHLSEIETLWGDFPAAEQALRRAPKRAEAANWWGTAFFAGAALAAALCGQGRYDEAAALTAAMPDEPGDWVIPHTVWRTARAQALAGLGREDEAVALAVEAVARSEPTDALNLRGDALLAQADVLRTCGRDAEAIRSAAAAVELYERKGNLVMAERARTLIRTGRRSPGPPPG